MDADGDGDHDNCVTVISKLDALVSGAILTGND